LELAQEGKLIVFWESSSTIIPEVAINNPFHLPVIVKLSIVENKSERVKFESNVPA